MHRIRLLLALTPALAFAQGIPLTTRDLGELGLVLSNYAYEEGAGSSSAATQKGYKLGWHAAFTQALDERWFWGADARQSHGNVNHSSAANGDKGSNPDVITEVRLTMGRDFPIGRQLLVLYGGLGFRSLYTDLQGLSTTGARGYRRNGQYGYLPLGLIHRFHAGPEARFSSSLEYDFLLEGRQQTYLSDVDASSNDPVNTQRQGYGLRLSGSYETASWSFGIYWYHWNIGESDAALRTFSSGTSSLVTVPRNTSSEAGLQLKWRFN